MIRIRYRIRSAWSTASTVHSVLAFLCSLETQLSSREKEFPFLNWMTSQQIHVGLLNAFDYLAINAWFARIKNRKVAASELTFNEDIKWRKQMINKACTSQLHPHQWNKSHGNRHEKEPRRKFMIHSIIFHFQTDRFSGTSITSSRVCSTQRSCCVLYLRLVAVVAISRQRCNLSCPGSGSIPGNMERDWMLKLLMLCYCTVPSDDVVQWVVGWSWGLCIRVNAVREQLNRTSTLS